MHPALREGAATEKARLVRILGPAPLHASWGGLAQRGEGCKFPPSSPQSQLLSLDRWGLEVLKATARRPSVHLASDL